MMGREPDYQKIRADVESVNRVRATMLWPDDQLQRQATIAVWTVDELAEEGRLRGMSLDGDVMVPFNLLCALASAPSRTELENEMRQRAERGRATGEALLLYFQLVMLQNAMLGKTDEKFTVSGLEAASAANKSESWFNNKAWRPFKPVSHLWAAWNIHRVLNPPRPLHPGNAARFHALANVIADFAEQHVPPNQANTLVEAGAMIRVFEKPTSEEVAAAVEDIERAFRGSTGTV